VCIAAILFSLTHEKGNPKQIKEKRRRKVAKIASRRMISLPGIVFRLLAQELTARPWK